MVNYKVRSFMNLLTVENKCLVRKVVDFPLPNLGSWVQQSICQSTSGLHGFTEFSVAFEVSYFQTDNCLFLSIFFFPRSDHCNWFSLNISLAFSVPGTFPSISEMDLTWFVLEYAKVLHLSLISFQMAQGILLYSLYSLTVVDNRPNTECFL